MARPNFFLRTKLLPPRPALDLLSRPRLTQKLQANLNSSITLVAADAGFGKTTLVADFVRSQSRQNVWYQLDHTDADPFVFLGYICHGIKKIAPNFGEIILSYLDEGGDDLLSHPERAVDLLLNEILESIEQPFILVLDDYHHIGRETKVHQLVDRLLQYSSDMLHLIVTTRDLPPLAIMRRRAQSAAVVINREDLLFTDDETRQLFRQTLNIELRTEEINQYRERTHGWITALQLIKQVAEQESHADENHVNIDLNEILRQSEKDIFDYFAEEVFSRETPETQQLLLRLSLLDSLPLDVCSRLFPEMRCAAVLPTLAQRNVFLTVAGDRRGGEEYRLHPLFRTFLRRRLRTEFGRAGVSEERIRIAEFFLANGQWEKALSHLIEAENYERAAQIVAEEGENWIADGAITAFGLFAEKIPNDILEKFPRSLLHRAEAARLQGEVAKSTLLLHRAVRLLHDCADTQGEAEALHSLASISRRRGDYAAALAFLEDAEKLIDEISETRMKCENTHGLCLIASGAWAQAERRFRQALEIAEKLSNKRYIRLIAHNLALPPGLRGDFGEALRWFKRIFRNDNCDGQLPQEAIGHLNIARAHVYRGEFTEAESHLNRSLELCQLYNLKFLRGEIFETYANYYREKQDFSHAEEFYERAQKAFDEVGIDPSTREFVEERALLALTRGDVTTARGMLENLIQTRQESGNEISLNMARLALCRVRMASNEIAVAAELEEILNFFHAQNMYYYQAQAGLLLATARFIEGNRPEMLLHLRRVLDLAARFDYEYWLRQEIKKNSALFAAEEIIERLPLDLRENVTRENVNPSQNAIDNAIVNSRRSIVESTAVVDLTLKLLGHAEIFRDPTKPFASDAWTTRRARDIFCYIATSKHRRVEKDVLLDVFWGEADLEAVEKNFHPTISHIRKALNSRQTFKLNFLIFRDGAYQLNSDLSYLIDTEEFEKLVLEAEVAKRAGDETDFSEKLESAYKLYRGEFMAGVHDDWAEERRGYFNDQFARILNALAKIAFKDKDWARTLKLANEILQSDPFREDVHRLVMRVLAAQGKRSAVKEQFENLKQLLKKELSIEPAQETRRAYQELFK